MSIFGAVMFWVCTVANVRNCFCNNYEKVVSLDRLSVQGEAAEEHAPAADRELFFLEGNGMKWLRKGAAEA